MLAVKEGAKRVFRRVTIEFLAAPIVHHIMLPAEVDAFSQCAFGEALMKPVSGNRSFVYALYANAALLSAILVSLIARSGSGTLLSSASAAQVSPPPIAGSGNLYLMPGQLVEHVWGCYVLNTDSQILCTYAYNGNQLRLMAARNIRFDHQLNNYNTQPDPDEIHRLVDIERERLHGFARPATQETPKDSSR